MAKQKNDGLSRRDFLKKTAVVGGAAGLGAMGLPGIASAATTTSDWMPATWDYTADVVVIGYGYAGSGRCHRGAQGGILRHHPREGSVPRARRQQPRVRPGAPRPVAGHLGRLQGVHHPR